MSIHPHSLANLKPPQPGERRAAKPASQRASMPIQIRVTPEQKRVIERNAESAGQTIKSYLLEGKI